MVKKIVIIGPESTGKSSLCEALAGHYAADHPTRWSPEFARQYLLEKGMDYRYEDLLTIARGQLQLEDENTLALKNELESHPGPAREALLFIDTDMMVMKVWSEYVFGKCHPFILEQIATRKYDGYLLTHTDLPWKKDELREYPDLESRKKLFHMYHDMLVHQSTPWQVITGSDELRLQNAVTATDRLLLR